MQQDDEDIQSPSDVADLSSTVCSIAKESIVNKEDDENSEGCRVCRSEDGDLYSPCLCSGSIQYVHQECLTQWLKYRNKESCEVCKHKYSFKPSYRTDMPSALPLFEIFTGIIRRTWQSIQQTFKNGMAFLIWAMLLPKATVHFYSLCRRLSGDSSEKSPIFFHALAIDYIKEPFLTFLCLLAYQLLRGLYILITTEGPQDLINLEPDHVEADPEHLRREPRARLDLVIDLLLHFQNQFDDIAGEVIADPLGLDSIFTLIKHTVVVFLYNATIMLFFGFAPSVIGGVVLRAIGVPADIHDGQTFLEVAVGFSILTFCCWVLHFFARCLKLSRLYRILGICFITLKVISFAFFGVVCIPVACGYWIVLCLRSLLTDWSSIEKLFPHFPINLYWILGILYLPFLEYRIVLKGLLRPGRRLGELDREVLTKEVLKLPTWRLARSIVDTTTYLFATIFITIFLPLRLLAVTTTVLPYNISFSAFSWLNPPMIFLFSMTMGLEFPCSVGQACDLLEKWIELWTGTIFNIVGLLRGLPGDEAEKPAQIAYFPLRIIGLCILVALSWMIAGTLVFSVPVSAGRLALFLLTGDPAAHEVLTVLFGVYVCLLTMRAVVSIFQFVPVLIVYLREISLRKRLQLIVRLTAIAIPVAFVLPMFLGFFIKRTFIIPMNAMSNQSPIQTPLQDWALGLSCLQCTYIVAMNINDHTKQTIQQIYADGLAGLRMNFIYRKLLIPMTMTVATVFAMSYVVVRIVISLSGMLRENAALAFVYSYPCVYFVLFCCLLILCVSISSYLKWIKEDIRKEKYLIGTQLINHEKHEKREQASQAPEAIAEPEKDEVRGKETKSAMLLAARPNRRRSL